MMTSYYKIWTQINYYAAYLILFFFIGCSSLNLTNETLNPEVPKVRLKNILVVGVSPDLEIRKEFEFKFARLLNQYKINALQSAVVFDSIFKNPEKTEEEMREQLELLSSKGYDVILVTLLRGVDENTAYSGENIKFDYHFRHFFAYYLMFQNAYYDKDRYKDYKVYHVQTSIYKLNNNSDLSLVWTASYDLINSDNKDKMIDKYIKKVINSLEKEKLIRRVK